MKRNILAILLLALMGGLCQGKAVWPQQKKLMKEVYNYLKKQPQISEVEMDEDQDIQFMNQGTKYLISLKEDDTEPMYLTMRSFFGFPPEWDRTNMLKTTGESNWMKMVKSYVTDESLIFSTELYLTDSKAFTSIFPKVLDVMRDTKNAYSDTYDKFAKENNTVDVDVIEEQPPTEVAHIEATTNYGDNDHPCPPVQNTNNDDLWLTNVITNPDNTVLEFIIYNRSKEVGGVGISPNSYILANGQKYYLSHAEGISYAPEDTPFPRSKANESTSIRFRLYFPPLPSDVSMIDFSEGSSSPAGWTEGWKVSGIKLFKRNPVPVTSSPRESQYHTWRYLDIEAQPTQTVLHASVTPKEALTHMYSEKSEYIQDTRSGKKYYLQKSTLGWPNEPTFSYDTTPIEYYDVYPALPPEVKYINIFDGNHYPARNIKIR